jgi:hypothetical protein
MFAQVITNAPNAPQQSSRSNALFYRISNHPQRALQDWVRRDHAVLLRHALIDTELAAPTLPEHLKSEGDPGSYIVQARSATTPAFQQWLRAAGARVISYVPDNAFLVRATADVAATIGQAAEVQAVLPCEPYYKLDAMLLALAVKKELSPHGRLNVVSFPGDTEELRRKPGAMGAEVLNNRAEPPPLGDVLVV